MSEPVKGARGFFASGFNCAESVSLGVCQALGIGEGVIPRAATGFGGGGGGSGGTCGALAGALLAVGLKYGRTSTQDERRRPYAISQRIYKAFVDEMGAAGCRELTGLDLRTPEGYQALRNSGLHDTVCTRAVELAERLAVEQLRPRG